MNARRLCPCLLAALSICGAGSVIYAQEPAKTPPLNSAQNSLVRAGFWDQKPDENLRLLGEAVVFHDLPGVRKALEKGIDVKNMFATNALLAAGGQGDVEIARLLLARGVAQGDKAALTEFLVGAMGNARTSRHLEIMETAIAAGADVKRRTDTGETFLMDFFAEPPEDAQTAPHVKGKTVGSILLDHGVSINAKNDNGTTALMMAIRNSSLNEFKMLIARGANVNAKRDDGETILMQAALGGSLDEVKALIAGGANVNAKRDNGSTALSLAQFAHRTKVSDLLEKAGAKE